MKSSLLLLIILLTTAEAFKKKQVHIGKKHNHAIAAEEVKMS